MKRQFLIFVFATFAVLGCDHAIWGPFRTHHGRVKIVNGSKEMVIKGELVICGQQFEFGNLRSNDSRTFLYQIGSCPGQDYRVAVTLESGSSLTRRVGYVTSGFDFSDELIVKRDNVVVGSAWVGNRLDNLSR
jgi:hypothetical protein